MSPRRNALEPLDTGTDSAWKIGFAAGGGEQLEKFGGCFLCDGGAM